VSDQQWAPVRAAIVEVFDEQAHRLGDLDASLIWQASSAPLATGGVTCWLTVSHRGAPDPHLEATATLTGQPTAPTLTADIGTFAGEVLADLDQAEGRPHTLAEATENLRRFLADHAALLTRLATS
jgi:hypothetical protein